MKSGPPADRQAGRVKRPLLLLNREESCSLRSLDYWPVLTKPVIPNRKGKRRLYFPVLFFKGFLQLQCEKLARPNPSFAASNAIRILRAGFNYVCERSNIREVIRESLPLRKGNGVIRHRGRRLEPECVALSVVFWLRLSACF